MRAAGISCCLLVLFVSFINGLSLKKFKRAPGYGGRKSVVAPINAMQRSAWECHKGCKKFCLSSCKRSCCAPGAPNYTPDMFPQLVNYQSSLPPPPPPPPSCPTGCPSTCYPNCDAGCCFPVAEQPAYPQNPALSPYDTGYGGYTPGDPCAAQGCSASCAPLCKPDCCRSQALNLSIRPAYRPGSSSPVPAPAPAPPPSPAKKPVKVKKIKKIVKKITHPKKGWLCVPQCQKLCKPVCKFDCCLPTHKFDKKYYDHRPSHPKPKKPAPAPPKAKVHDIKPVASPQRVPDVIKLVVPPSAMDAVNQAASEPDDFSDAMGPAAPATCPGECPESCSPSCDWNCCSPYMMKLTVDQMIPGSQPQQPIAYQAVPPNPMAPAYFPTAPPPASPGLVPTQSLSCPAPSCPDSCAPSCSPNCCQGMKLLPQNWDKRNTVPRAV